MFFKGDHCSAKQEIILDPRPLPTHGLCEAVALAGEDHNMRMVDQSVNESGGETVIAKNGVPLGELQIGGNYETLTLVTI